MSNAMKIVRLQAENIKRLVAVNIEPDGALVEITGRNGAGKTSVLDSIWWALAGTKNHQPEPIRKGENEARVTLDLGELVIKREFAKSKKDENKITTRISVETPDGAKFGSPQTMLDRMMGALTFDPLAFSRMDSRGQYDHIKRMAGIDLTELEEERKRTYEERTEVNRLAKQSKSQADGISVPDETPGEEINISDLISQLRDAREEDDHHLALERKREHLTTLVRDAEYAVQHAQETLKLHKSNLADFGELPVRETGKLIADLESRIENANESNQAVADLKRKRSLLQSSADYEAMSNSLTNKLDDIKHQAQRMVDESDMPVDGLDLTGGMVTWNGIPLEQASDAEQLRISCAIAMRENTQFRVIRVRDGSLLDEESLEVIREMAEESGYQVWIERVDSSGKIGFVIEDGQVSGNE